MTQRGIFITLEGGEGVGKSTLLQRLCEWLEARGVDHISTREPGGTPLAEDIRDIALTPRENHTISELTTALLMNAARADHLASRIRPALNAGKWVVCDRFADSTRVYQSIGGRLTNDTLTQLERIVTGATYPDLTLILDGDPERLMSRRKQRGGKTDIFEQADMTFHHQVRERFLAIAAREPDRCMVVNAEHSADDVFAAVRAVVSERFNLDDD